LCYCPDELKAVPSQPHVTRLPTTCFARVLTSFFSFPIANSNHYSIFCSSLCRRDQRPSVSHQNAFACGRCRMLLSSISKLPSQGLVLAPCILFGLSPGFRFARQPELPAEHAFIRALISARKIPLFDDRRFKSELSCPFPFSFFIPMALMCFSYPVVCPFSLYFSSLVFVYLSYHVPSIHRKPYLSPHNVPGPCTPGALFPMFIFRLSR